MNPLLRVMQVIYSSWIISGEDDDTAIPTGPGVFDYALHDLAQRGILPKMVLQHLHFVETACGLTCLEAAQIQKLATEGKMTSDPNPSYVRSDIAVSKRVARHWLARLGIPENEAINLGNALRKSLQEAERQLEPLNS